MNVPWVELTPNISSYLCTSRSEVDWLANPKHCFFIAIFIDVKIRMCERWYMKSLHVRDMVYHLNPWQSWELNGYNIHKYSCTFPRSGDSAQGHCLLATWCPFPVTWFVFPVLSGRASKALIRSTAPRGCRRGNPAFEDLLVNLSLVKLAVVSKLLLLLGREGKVALWLKGCCCCWFPEKYLKFPPESTESIFFSSSVGLSPPVNLNLQILTLKRTI